MSKLLVDKPKKPFPMYRKKGRSYTQTLTKSGVEIWGCGECGTLHAYQYGDTTPKELAEECCLQKYCDCGNKILPGYTGPKCQSCHSLEREVKRIEQAEEVYEFEGPIYDEPHDKYYENVEDFMEYLYEEWNDGNEDSIPEWVYPCNLKPFGSLDASSIVENELEDHYDDAIDEIVDLDGLQELLDKWVEKQTLKSWEVDFSKKIRVKPLLDQVKEEAREEFRTELEKT